MEPGKRHPSYFLAPRPVDRGQNPADRASLDALRRLATEMAGRKLPGERELASRLDLSRQRLRALLAVLEAEGIVERRQGSGTYAADPMGADVSHVGLLIDARLKLGGDPFFSLLVERLQLCLQTAGVHCVVERITGEGRPRFLGDGMITVGLAGLGALAHLRAEDPPAVSLLAGERGEEAFRSTGRVSLLLADDQEAGATAARRLLHEGCQRLIFFGRSELPASQDRWKGVCRAVAASEAEGAAVAEFIESAMNYGAGRATALTLTERFGTAEDVADIGLIAANDWLAVGLRSGLAASNSPLWDRSLVSFDGLPIAADPALNIRSLAFPFDMVAEDALAELRRLARHRGGRNGRVIRYSAEWSDGGAV